VLATGNAVRRVVIASAGQPWERVRGQVENLLGVCDRLLAARAPDWVGHCKALVESADGSGSYASLTAHGEPVTWAGRAGMPGVISAPILTLYCVVYGTTDDVVEAVATEALRVCLPWANAVSAAAPRTVPDVIALGSIGRRGRSGRRGVSGSKERDG